MPRLPGREGTRKTLDSIKGLLVSSFVMQHEEWLWRRPCIITGCDHRMGPKTDEPGWLDWKPCGENLPAFVVHEKHVDVNLGMVCPCHVAEILNNER